MLKVHRAASESIALFDVVCRGDEAGLRECAAERAGDHNCDSNDTTVAICATSNAASTRGTSGPAPSAGLVEVQRHGLWAPLYSE